MNVDPADQKAFWDQLWNSEENHDFWTRVSPEVVKLMSSITPRNHSDVLDLGCGLGRNAIAFAQAHYTVTAVDLSESAVNYVRASAQKLGLKILTKVSHFGDDIFEPESFDVVLAVNVLYHGLPTDFERAIANVRCWLRSQGLFYFTCPTLEDGEYGRGIEVAPHTFEFERGHIHFNADWTDIEALLDGICLVSREKKEREWERNAVRRFSSRWQILVQKK